jgi:hypothetical protein
MSAFFAGDSVCIAEHWLQFGSGICALIAAVVWWKASRSKVPHPITFDNIDTFSNSAVRQSRLNALAALFAAIAALLQFPLAFMPTCWG